MAGRIDNENGGSKEGKGGEGEEAVIEEEHGSLKGAERGVSLRRAEGVVTIERVRGRSTVTRSFSKYPLKIMLPSKVARPSCDCVWIYLLTYGGGILAGDDVAVNCSLAEACTAVVTTQTSTKIFVSSNQQLEAIQSLHATVASSALLAILPDPITCFQGARYQQQQTIRVAPGGSLLLVDWLTAGRMEKGEIWAFEELSSSNRVLSLDGRPVVLENLLLQQSTHHSPYSASPISLLRLKMGSMMVVGMMLIIGPRLSTVASHVEDQVKDICNRWMNAKDPSLALFASSSNIGEEGEFEGLLVRFASKSTEVAYRFLRSALAPLDDQVGVAPYNSLGG